MTTQRDSAAPASISRRGFLRSSGAAAITPVATPMLLTACVGDGDSDAGNKPEVVGTVPVVLEQGTNLAVSVSPDGKTLAMDLQGLLWTLPIGGGEARQLTGYFDDVARPHWSPDGRTIAFQSYRSGNFHIWLIDADGSNLRQLTDGPYDHREPRFSPDGSKILCSSDRSGSYGIYTVEIGSKAVRVVVDTPAEDGEPIWSPDGTQIAFVSGSRILVVPAQGGTPEPVVTSGSNAAPSWTPDGRGLVYAVSGGGTSVLTRSGKPITPPEEDVFRFPVSWLSATEYLYTADGQIKRAQVDGGAAQTIAFRATVMLAPPQTYARRKRNFDSTAPRDVKGIASPMLSPDGTRAAFVALNQVWIVDVSSGAVQQITQDAYYKCHPAWSSDGTRLAYSCDRGGKLDIWERVLASGAERQITATSYPCVSARWSPDDTQLACLDNSGNVLIVDAASGAARKPIGPLFTPGRPEWAPDGATIALSAIRPYSARYREGISVVLTVDVATGQPTYSPVVADRSLGPRGDDGPAWGRNGTLSFAMGSTLWQMPVDGKGLASGPAVRLNDEVTDAVSVNAAGTQVLYLCKGKLRLLSTSSRSAVTVPMQLQWRLAKPEGVTVVRAGRLWDGRKSTLETDVDVVIQGNRIVAVEPHRERTGVRWIDASAHTVMPGLMEMHGHIQGKHFNTAMGDREGRIFLSFGITTTRGLAELAYHSVEHKEAIDSGARVAPRHFATGEAFDGTKIYYDVMRAIYDEEQLERELERAAALDYDLVKCYVRMPLRWQKRVIEFAHQQGIHATSHYLFPWLSFGGDGQEHMGATSRFGYSRTVSPLGKTYQDVTSMYRATGATRTPTLFGIDHLAAETPTMVNEERMRTLWPTWQYNSVTTSFAGTPAPLSASIRNNVKGVMDLMAAGAKVMQGTDFYIVAPAFTLHLNLRAMVKGGMSPVAALKTATSIPGDFLDAGHGAIEVGKLADLVFVQGNPLERIEDAANVRGVVVNGVHQTMDALVAPFRGRAGNPIASAAGQVAVARAQATHGAPRDSRKAFAESVRRNEPWWHNEEFVAETMKSCCVQLA